MEKPKKSDIVSNGAVALVNDIIENAHKSKASDIHFEPTEHNLRIRYRIDGLLKTVLTIQQCMVQSIIIRIKIMVNLDIGESRLPQDGKMQYSIDGSDLDLRISTMPTIFGEKIVIRILNRNSFFIPLEKLGMAHRDLLLFEKILKKAQGLVLVTGPTGSGKTTTLYSALNTLNSPEKNIITIEDPVEYQLPGINQIQINNKSGLTFAKGLRAILRQDPDIIMVGEIRDNETAKIAVQAALTGHLVFSTLHTNDAVRAISRLEDMGIEPYLIASSLIGIISQRLVRLTCPKCKECSFSGFRGRIGIYEFLGITEEIKELISSRASIKQISKSAGIISLFEAGMEKIKEGLTTKPEIERVVSEN